MIFQFGLVSLVVNCESLSTRSLETSTSVLSKVSTLKLPSCRDADDDDDARLCQCQVGNDAVAISVTISLGL